MQDQSTIIDGLRQVAPYVSAHRGILVVVALPGQIVVEQLLSRLIADITRLSDLGINLVLVPGIRPQIDQRLATLGIESQRVDGLRVTDKNVLPVVIEEAGRVLIQMDAMLSCGWLTQSHDVHLRAVSGNFVAALPYGIHDGVDFCYTGVVHKIDVKGIRRLLSADQLVVLPPLGYSSTGEVFNLRAEDLAMRLAVDLSADKLIYLSEQDQILDAANQVMRQLTPADCDALLQAKGYRDELALYLKNGAHACRHAVPRTYIIGYRIDGGMLVELFTRDGCGTMINSDVYEDLRDARLEDAAGILQLIRPLEEAGLLVNRPIEQLEREVTHFSIIERDSMIIACAAMYPHADAMCELACFATHRDYLGRGYGRMLLAELERKARALGVRSLFALTTRASHWFRERGFTLASPEQLPPEKRHSYNRQRNSQVLIKLLD